MQGYMLYANLHFHNAIMCVSSFIFLLLLWAVEKYHRPSKLCPSLISRDNIHLDEKSHLNYILISFHLVKRRQQIYKVAIKIANSATVPKVSANKIWLTSVQRSSFYA